MMNNKQATNFRDPLLLGNMPRLQRPVGDMVLPGYSSSQSLPRYSQEEPASYSGSYFSMCLNSQEERDLSTHWNSTRTCLQSSRSPLLHPSNSDGPLPSRIVYRPDHMAVPVEKSPSLKQNELAEKQKATFYDGASDKHSPVVPGVHTPIAVRKINVGSTSSQSESTIGLAIPKPIYGHSTCCGELSCSSGSSYGNERGTARIHSAICDQDWVLQYGSLSPPQSSGQDALMQGRVLELDHGQRLPLKDTQTEGYLAMRPSRSLRMPAFVDPRYSGFPYGGSSHSVLGHSREQCHSLQFPSKGCHRLPSSPSCTYEDMQLAALSYSKVYPDHSTATPTQTQSPPHSAFYYTRGCAEVSNSAAYSDISGNHRPDIAGCISKHDAPNPPGRYRISHRVFGDIPSPCHITPRSHSFLQSYEVSPYQIYKMHPITGQKRTYSEGPGSILSVPLPGQLQDYSSVRAPLLPSPSRLCGKGFGSGAFHPVQPRFEHGNHTQESVGRCSMLDDGLTSPREVDSTVKTPVNSDSNLHTALCTREFINNQSVNTNDLVTGESSVLKWKKKKCDKLIEVEVPKKTEGEDNTERWKGTQLLPPSPPMPVINNVFSLAPYKAYLEATGVLPASTMADSGEPAPDMSDMKSGTNKQQTAEEPTDRLMCNGDAWSSQKKDMAKTKELRQFKTEQTEEVEVRNEPTDENISDRVHLGFKEMGIGKEEANVLSGPPDRVLDLSVKKNDSQEAICKIQMLTSGSGECPNSCEVQSPVLENGGNDKATPPPLKLSNTQLRFQHIPPQYLKLSTFRITLPDTLRTPGENVSDNPLCTLGSSSSTDATLHAASSQDTSRQACHHFMELHHSLCRLVSNSVARSPEKELRAWLDSIDLGPPSSSGTKMHSICTLLGLAVRGVWLRCTDTAAMFQKVMVQLESFVASRRCPFPHVVRAGALFIPMVVMKESLFPQVPGAFIDQVLQEQRVELRPTTLSEERQLAQLQKRACSSKLRRLLSLKYLPDVYPDVMNLFYHTCVSKHLDAEQKVQQVDTTDRSGGCHSQSSTCKTAGSPKNMKNATCFKKLKRKGRRKSDSKRLFFGEKVPKAHGAEHVENTENWSIINSFSQSGDSSSSTCKDVVDTIKIKVEQSSDLEQIGTEEPDKVWGPVMSDEVSSGDSDTEATTVSGYCQSSGFATLPGRARSHSGMILKLRKVLLNKGSNRLSSGQQPVLDTRVYKNSKKLGGEEEDGSVYLRMRPVLPQGEKGCSSATEYTSSPSKAMRLRRPMKPLHPRRPLVQVKYCSYLTASHSGRRHRWVLRSAVRTARRAMKNRYPELVGKRICHLYEEKDKTEVWYKGLVVGVHEPHPNPLKTVFEVKYDSEPEWQYYLELLMDYKKGWLKVED